MCCLYLTPVILLRHTESLLSSSSMPLASKSKMVVGMKLEVASDVQKCSDFKQTNPGPNPLLTVLQFCLALPDFKSVGGCLW